MESIISEALLVASVLGVIAGALLSVLMEYTPKFAPWFAKQETTKKKLITLGLLVVAASGSLLISCYGPFEVVSCTEDGIWIVVTAFVFAITGSQSTHSLTKKDGYRGGDQ